MTGGHDARDRDEGVGEALAGTWDVTAADGPPDWAVHAVIANANARPEARRPTRTCCIALILGISVKIRATDEERPRIRGSLGVEARRLQYTEPGLRAERAEPMSLANHVNAAVGAAQDKFVFGLDPAVGWITIACALAEGRMPSQRIAATTATSTWPEAFRGVVRREHRQATGLAVCEGCLRDTQQISLAAHIVGRIVNQNRVEEPAEADRIHIALDVLAVGIELAGYGEHLRRDVHQRQLESVLQMRRDVTAAAAKIQHATNRNGGRPEHLRDALSILLVLARRRNERPPRRQLVVQAILPAHAVHHRVHSSARAHGISQGGGRHDDHADQLRTWLAIWLPVQPCHRR